LRELGDEAADLGEFDAERIHGAWKERPEMMAAFVARAESGEVLGLATATEGFAIYANGRFGTIPEMYVAPSARSRGVGSSLVDAIAAYGRERGWSRIDVTAPESDRFERTVAFYQRCGFRYTGPKLKLYLT
jgi:GNAT superfamily N-acetyltransferase